MAEEEATLEPVEVLAEVKIVALRRTSQTAFDTIQVPGEGGTLQSIEIGVSEIVGFAPFFVDPTDGFIHAWAVLGHERLNRMDYAETFQFPQTVEAAQEQWENGTPMQQAPFMREGLVATMRSVGVERQLSSWEELPTEEQAESPDAE